MPLVPVFNHVAHEAFMVRQKALSDLAVRRGIPGPRTKQHNAGGT
ncbi:hypothetical protein [Microvirga sp. 2TAF3]